MGRKRVAALLVAALMALGLAGCGADGSNGKDKDKDAAKTIAPAQLSEEEQNLAQLLGLGMESYDIFEFQAGGAQSLQFNTYELVAGDWSRIQGGGGAELTTGTTGRIALTFGKIPDGVRLAFQTEGQFMSTSYWPEPGDDVSGMTCATSALDGTQTIELEQEIPLVLQVVTSKNEVRVYPVDYFGMPRELDKHGYEHVYAITVMFSEKAVGNLSQNVPSAAPGEPSAEPSPAE